MAVEGPVWGPRCCCDSTGSGANRSGPSCRASCAGQSRPGGSVPASGFRHRGAGPGARRVARAGDGVVHPAGVGGVPFHPGRLGHPGGGRGTGHASPYGRPGSTPGSVPRRLRPAVPDLAQFPIAIGCGRWARPVGRRRWHRSGTATRWARSRSGRSSPATCAAVRGRGRSGADRDLLRFRPGTQPHPGRPRPQRRTAGCLRGSRRARQRRRGRPGGAGAGPRCGRRARHRRGRAAAADVGAVLLTRPIDSHGRGADAGAPPGPAGRAQERSHDPRGRLRRRVARPPTSGFDPGAGADLVAGMGW